MSEFEQTAGGEQVEEQAPPWAAHLAQDFAGQLGRLDFEPAGYEEPERGYEDDGEFADDEYGEFEDGDPDGFDPDDDGDVYDELVGDALEQERAEEREQVLGRLDEIEGQRREEQLADLLDSWPELQDEQVAAEVDEAASGWAEELGAPGLADDPRFILMTYLANKAFEQAEGEEPAGEGSTVALEMGGAAVGEVEPEGNVFQQMHAAKGRDPNKLRWSD